MVSAATVQKLIFDDTDTNILRACVHLLLIVYFIQNCILRSHNFEIFVFTSSIAKYKYPPNRIILHYETRDTLKGMTQRCAVISKTKELHLSQLKTVFCGLIFLRFLFLAPVALSKYMRNYFTLSTRDKFKGMVQICAAISKTKELHLFQLKLYFAVSYLCDLCFYLQ